MKGEAIGRSFSHQVEKVFPPYRSGMDLVVFSSHVEATPCRLVVYFLGKDVFGFLSPPTSVVAEEFSDFVFLRLLRACGALSLVFPACNRIPPHTSASSFFFQPSDAHFFSVFSPGPLNWRVTYFLSAFIGAWQDCFFLSEINVVV